MNNTSRVLLRLSLVTLTAFAIAGCAADVDPGALTGGPMAEQDGPGVSPPELDDPHSVDEAWEGPVPEANDTPGAQSENHEEIEGEMDDVLTDPTGAGIIQGGIEKVEPAEINETQSTPAFQLPFPCGQYWSGQTRTNHVPQRAVDFNRYADYGDTVVAAAYGKVRVVANYGTRGYGRWIEITHSGGYATRYAHLSVQAVRVGQVVSRGQRIGNVGNTGGSTGSHLHYELRRYGSLVRALFNGSYAYYYGTRTYRSRNCR